MKKFMFLLIGVFILCGCTNEYTLTISDKEIKEEINVTIDNSIENKELLKFNYYPLHGNQIDTYKKEIEENGNYLNVKLEYTYDSEEFGNADSLNQCFENKVVELNNKDYYYFKLSDMNHCVSTDDININIVTKNKVLLHNADSVKGNKYTWHVTSENFDDFVLEIKIAKGSDNSTIIVIATIVLIIVVGLIVYFVYKKRQGNRNDI